MRILPGHTEDVFDEIKFRKRIYMTEDVRMAGQVTGAIAGSVETPVI